jgi:hypothetical protein
VCHDVQAAVEFSVWAFKSPEQRAHEARVQAHVQAEAAAAQRMAVVSVCLHVLNLLTAYHAHHDIQHVWAATASML